MDGAEAVGLLGTAATVATAVGGAVFGVLGVSLAFRMARRAFS